MTDETAVICEHRSPECRDANCKSCPGQGWCLVVDDKMPCTCWCHAVKAGAAA